VICQFDSPDKNKFIYRRERKWYHIPVAQESVPLIPKHLPYYPHRKPQKPQEYYWESDEENVWNLISCGAEVRTEKTFDDQL
jgi:hypothetical protein